MINVITVNGVGYAPHVMYPAKTVNIAGYVRDLKVIVPNVVDIKKIMLTGNKMKVL